MQFKDIIGQESLKNKLINSVKENRISHAQMFIGKGSVGKLALAYAYAQYINCTDKKENDSCGVCSSCRKYAAMSHPDLFFSYPVNTNATSATKATETSVKKDPVSADFLVDWKKYLDEVKGYPDLFQWYQRIGIENKQGFISKEEGRNVIHQMQYKAVEAKYKVLIVWMVEKMQELTSNILLKMIEEPPENTLLFLIAEEKEKLLPTILSRVQQTYVPPIENDKLTSFLLEQHQTLTQDQLSEIANLAGGDVFKANEIISNSAEIRENFDLFVEWMRLCYKKGSLDGIKTWVEKISKFGREKQKSFLNYTLRMVRESLLLNYGDKSLVKILHNEEQFLSKFSPFIHLRNAILIQERVNMAIYEIERNAHSANLFADLSLKMSTYLKLDAVAK